MLSRTLEPSEMLNIKAYNIEQKDPSLRSGRQNLKFGVILSVAKDL